MHCRLHLAGIALNRLRIIDTDGRGARTIHGASITSGTPARRPSA
jgi:hypothetical protein